MQPGLPGRERADQRTRHSGRRIPSPLIESSHAVLERGTCPEGSERSRKASQQYRTEEGHHASTLHFFRYSEAGQLQERRAIVDVLNELLEPGTRLDRPWERHQERHFERLFEHPAFVVPAVLTEVKPLVGAIDYQGVFPDRLQQ